MTVFFIAKEQNCAVAKLYNLLSLQNDFKHFKTVINTGNINLELLKDDEVLMERITIDENICIIGHFDDKKDLINLFSLSDSILDFDWNTIDIKSKFIFGHICFGVKFLEEWKVIDYCSFYDEIGLFYGYGPTDLQIIDYFFKQFFLLQKEKSEKQVLKSSTKNPLV